MNLDMPFAADFAPQGILVPDFTVLIEGVPVPPSVRRSIMGVSVTQQANQPAAFHMQVSDPRFELVEAAQGLLAEGKRIEIALGYVGNTQPMIEGEITSLGVDLEESGGLTLSIEGFDALHAASRNSGYRQFREDQSDSAIVREIAADFVPFAVVDETGPRGNGRIQQGITDLAYLQELAEHHHFQLWVDGRTLFFMRERPAPLAVFARQVNLISFSAHFSTAGQVAEIEVRGWDMANKKAIVASVAATDSIDYQKALSPTGLSQVISGAIGLGASRRKQIIHAQGEVNSIAEARDRAKAEMAKLRQQLLTANGSAIGDPKLRVGGIVTLMDMGRFSLRTYVMDKVTHQINASGYRTQFEMRTYP